MLQPQITVNQKDVTSQFKNVFLKGGKALKVQVP